MSQYRDPFIGRGEEVSGGSNGGSESRNRRNNEEHMYQRRNQEDDGSQYSPSSEYSSIHGFPAAPATDMGSRPSARPIQQPPRRPQQPMSSRQGGNGGQQSFPVLPVPRTPGNNNSNDGGRRPPPPRPVKRDYIPSSLDLSEVQEVQQNLNFSYRLNQQPVRNQTRYSQQSDDDNSPISPAKSPTGRPSATSPRSIFIGFDPSNPPPTDPNSLGVIPNFPIVPPASGSNRKSSSTGPPPSARRGTSSYYSQQALMVSPIPEESSGPPDRHGSYASSTAIPSNWVAEEVEEYYTNRRTDVHSDSDDDESGSRFVGEAFHDAGEERGLVRQASLGRKSRPVITEIKGPGGVKVVSTSSKSSSESFKTGRSGSVSAGRGASRSPAEKSSPTLNPIVGVGGSGASLPFPPSPQAQSSVSSSSGSGSSIIAPPLAYTPGDYMSERLSFPRRASQSSSQAYELQPTAGAIPRPPPAAAAASGGPPGRRIPPRLNIDAVREAEARGSLTSLPDLIRRATKLAAVLETGRPDSRWGGRRGSYMESSSGGRSRDTDSISDILASFPPPVLAQGKNRNSRTLSQWPLPDDFTHETESSIHPSKRQRRRICGLPLWAFVLLVILALLVICAAVIVPLQLVNLSKGHKGDNGSDQALVAQCKEQNPCQNGGENIATSDFCGCVCTNGFTGSDCTQIADSSCTTINLKDRYGGRIKGIQNVTMGNALPRLFDIADPYYNIELDMAMVLAVFSNESISCTAQNALVTFNGEAIPDSATTTTAKRELAEAIAGLGKRQTSIVTDTTATSTAAAASTTASSTADSRTVELDPDAIDFARVVVLYLTNSQTLTIASEAQSQLQAGFTAGRDFGDLSVGNNITVDFDNRSIELSNGSVVGSVTANSTNTTATADTSSEKMKRAMESYFVA